jgi:hypothetical protein
MYLQVNIMLMGDLRQACSGALRTYTSHRSACCRKTVGGNMIAVLPTMRTQEFYVSLLRQKFRLVSKFESLRKCLALCGTDMHRVAHTIHVGILGQALHRQTKVTGY